jgi:hypothetical protein
MNIDMDIIIKLFSTRSGKEQISILQDWRSSMLTITLEEQEKYFELLNVIQHIAEQQANWGASRKNSQKNKNQEKLEKFGPPIYKANKKYGLLTCETCRLTITNNVQFSIGKIHYHPNINCFPTEYAEKMTKNKRFNKWLNTGEI